MPPVLRWARSFAQAVRQHRVELVVLFAAIAILVFTRGLDAPTRSGRGVPASLRDALTGRSDFGTALDVIVPPATESLLGRRASRSPDGRALFDERPCFFVTPQPSSVSYGDVLVEYADPRRFETELAAWVSERASVEIRHLARGTLHLRHVRRTDGRAIPDPSAPCNFDATRPDTVVMSEVTADASFLGWRLPTSRTVVERASTASATQADISVAGEDLRVGAVLSEVRTITRKQAVKLGPRPGFGPHPLDEVLGLSEFAGRITIEAFDATRRELTLRFETTTNEEARPSGMPREGLCGLGVSRKLRAGEVCRYVPGQGDMLVTVSWNEGSRSGAAFLNVVGYRTTVQPAGTAGLRPTP
jgi:hypothetical protein